MKDMKEKIERLKELKARRTPNPPKETRWSMKKYERFVLPLTILIAFSVIFKDILLGLLFGFVFYIANDKKDCCK